MCVYPNDIVGIPGSDEWGQPGMRIGYLAPGGMWDLNADVGFVHRSGPHFDGESTLQLMPQLQVNIPVRSSFRPFVNAGVGLSRISTAFWADEVITGTRPVYGAGIGVRKSVSDHHGLVRAEFRYDYLPKWEKRLDAYDTVSYAASNQLSVKLGFDLLLSR
jgi:hypothetical protein